MLFIHIILLHCAVWKVETTSNHLLPPYYVIHSPYQPSSSFLKNRNHTPINFFIFIPYISPILSSHSPHSTTSIHLPTHSPTHLPTHSPTHLPTHSPTHLFLVVPAGLSDRHQKPPIVHSMHPFVDSSVFGLSRRDRRIWRHVVDRQIARWSLEYGTPALLNWSPGIAVFRSFQHVAIAG